MSLLYVFSIQNNKFIGLSHTMSTAYLAAMEHIIKAQLDKTNLVYLMDPLCGWCYGASGAIQQLAKAQDFSIELLPVGLFSGSGAPIIYISYLFKYFASRILALGFNHGSTTEAIDMMVPRKILNLGGPPF